MKLARTIFRVCSFVVCVWIAGCTVPDPVKGWKSHYANLDPPNRTNYHNYPNTWYYSPDQIYQIDQSIINDHKNFVETLKKKYPTLWVAEVYYYEDGTGQHTVKLVIEIGPEEFAEYYLMYDKTNVRTKVIRGSRWHHFHI